MPRTPHARVRKTWQHDLLDRLATLRVLPPPPRRVHLAVLVEPYLSMILDGRKTVESRFTRTRKPPFECVSVGDVIALKRSSGPVVGVCTVREAQSHELTPRTLLMLRLRYAVAIGDESDAFWSGQRDKCFASMIGITGVRRVEPFTIDKSDRRGWVVLG